MKIRNITKLVTSLIGLAVGFIMIAIGFNVQSPETHRIGEYTLLGDPISFGADFYTEIYAVTQDAGNAVNNATREICSAIGWLIVAIGAFDVCFFFCKMAEIDEDRLIRMGQQRAPTSIPSVLNSVSKETTEKPAIASSSSMAIPCSSSNSPVDKWVCSNCQAENSADYGQCMKCGNSKSDNKAGRELTEQEKSDGYWICKKCSTKNLVSRGTCWSCDSLR